MAAAMTNVAVPISDGASAIWTSLYTAGGAITLNVQNRGDVDLLVRVNGSSTAANDAAEAAAEVLRPKERIALVLATGDKVFGKPLRDETGAGRVTLRV